MYAHLIEKINHVNQTKADAYIEALTHHRSDVRGLPFTLGDACRLPTERGQLFQIELSRLRAGHEQPRRNGKPIAQSQAQPESEAAIKAQHRGACAGS